jgi:replicative superfamily II helicase
MIVSFARFIVLVLLKNIIIELPTGHGKTLIIAALALNLSK